MLYEVITNVARALIAAHGQSPPVIHRDLKPENIMVLEGGAVAVRLTYDGGGHATFVITSYSIHYTKLYDAYGARACELTPIRKVRARERK